MSLPAEVRVQIYGHILYAITLQRPISDTPDQYRAIILASKQICCEFELEAFKHAKELQSKLKGQWHLGGLLVAPPCCLSDCFKFKISLPLAAPSPDANKQRSPSVPLFDLLRIHFPIYTVYHYTVSPNTTEQSEDPLSFVLQRMREVARTILDYTAV